MDNFDQSVVLTGDRPTGPLHLGHYAGSLSMRLALQQTSNSKKYILVADTQGLTDYFDKKSIIKTNVVEVIKDYLAVGIDPNSWIIFLQSNVRELFELSSYFANLVTFNNLIRIPTLKAEIQQKDFDNNMPMGFLGYPISQAADLLLFDAQVVPVGIDQVPLIEFANDIGTKYNRLYQVERFLKVTPLLTNSPKILGIDGKNKASKSLNNCIYLKDEEKVVWEKVNQMYTDPDHIKISDPGKVEGNMVFHYLDHFYNDKDHLNSLKDQYKKGGLGDVSLKKLLTKVLNEFLDPIRQKRHQIKDDYVIDILKSGSNKAKNVAQTKINQIRQDLGIYTL